MANTSFRSVISTVEFADGETTIFTSNGNFLINGFILSNAYQGNTNVNLTLNSGNSLARLLSNTVMTQGTSLSVVGNGESLFAANNDVLKVTVTSTDGVVDIVLTMIAV